MRQRMARRLLLIALLAFAGAACGTRRSVIEPIPADAPAREPAARRYIASRPLRHGEFVAIELVDGSRVRGDVAALEPDSLSIRVAWTDLGRSPALFQSSRPTRRVAYSDIERAEVIGEPAPPHFGEYLFAWLAALSALFLISEVSD